MEITVTLKMHTRSGKFHLVVSDSATEFEITKETVNFADGLRLIRIFWAIFSYMRVTYPHDELENGRIGNHVS